ncbi:Bud site selection protein 6, partial [Tulasnella sp. 408]
VIADTYPYAQCKSDSSIIRSMLEGERPVPDERLLFGFSKWTRYMAPEPSLPPLRQILRKCWEFSSVKRPSLCEIWLGVKRTNGRDEDFPGKFAEKDNSILSVAKSEGSRDGLSSDTPAPFRSSGSKSRGGPSGGVESTVTRLLVAIKRLLESLTSWSSHKISEQDVSDVELRSVPEDLRNVLETCLAEDASPETLERFLPQVREIITDLLQGLRNKQSQFRAMTQERAQRRAERQNSASTSGSGRQSNRRSGSKPRPLPAPRIPEEEPGHPLRQPLPSEPIPPPVQAPPPQVVASTVPLKRALRRMRASEKL